MIAWVNVEVAVPCHQAPAIAEMWLYARQRSEVSWEIAPRQTSGQKNTTDRPNGWMRNARLQANLATTAYILSANTRAHCGKHRAGACFILRVED